MKTKKTIAISVAFLGLASLMPAASAQTAHRLIIPGVKIGQTNLGPDGARALRRLPPPKASDAGMSQNRLVWVSGKSAEGRRNTLFIHTTSNGALEVKPTNGVTIDCIRVSSSWFHTQSGLAVGSTLRAIQRRFPQALPINSDHTVYDDVRQGIAFEFAQRAAPATPCIAIMVHSRGKSSTATAQEVTALLAN